MGKRRICCWAVSIPLQAFLMVLMVNARHLFYGLSMLEEYSADHFIIPSMVIILIFLILKKRKV